MAAWPGSGPPIWTLGITWAGGRRGRRLPNPQGLWPRPGPARITLSENTGHIMPPHTAGNCYLTVHFKWSAVQWHQYIILNDFDYFLIMFDYFLISKFYFLNIKKIKIIVLM